MNVLFTTLSQIYGEHEKGACRLDGDCGFEVMQVKALFEMMGRSNFVGRLTY